MTRFSVPCPYDAEPIELEVTFEGDPPYLNLNAPALVAHMKQEHPELQRQLTQPLRRWEDDPEFLESAYQQSKTFRRFYDHLSRPATNPALTTLP